MKCIYSKIFLFICINLLGYYSVMAQVPTNQDCLGAIPVCQTTYWQANSYSGQGNYDPEINGSGGTCLASGELNDVWYTFTVISSGQLSFVIQPNNNSDDYDWALFNLTNANCGDIYNDPGLQVCCNYSATDGATGMYSPPNASCNASASDGTISPTVGVTAGQTYVLNVSNFSSSNFGYNLNFGASTASIFDNVPPVFQSVNTAAITCGTNQITFTFSENVLCSTAAACDFVLTGPGGPYTVTGITSAACAVGAPNDNTFTITVTPAITAPGSYTISLVNTCSSVADNCGNLAAPASFNFINTAPGVSITPTTDTLCAGGCTSLTVSGATSYSWSNGLGTAATVNPCPLVTTTYTVTGTATGCTSTADATITVEPIPTVTATAAPASICTGQSSTLTANGATTYSWQPGGLSGSSVSVSPGTTTIYTVTGTSGNCSSSATITITVNPTPVLNITPANPAICDGQSVGLTLNSTVALSGCVWNPTNGLTPSNSCNPTANPAVTTTYNVQGQTAQGCTNTASVTVTVNPNPTVTVSSAAPSNTICDGQCTQLTATSNPAANTWAWLPATGLSSTGIYNPNACPTTTTMYTVTSQTVAGCTGSNSINIIVNPVPILTVTPQPANICDGGSIQLNVTGVPALSGCSWTPNNTLTPTTGSCSPTANPTVTTIYTVTGQSAAGCTGSTSATVTVNANPAITITPASATICVDGSTTLQASDLPVGLVATWAWLPTTGINPANSANPTVNPTTTTIYSVTGTSAASCSGSASITVTVNPLPVLSFSVLPTLCVSSPGFILSQASPAGGIYFGPGVNSGVFTPSSAGTGTHTIFYSYSDPNTGCSDTISQTITINSGIPVTITPTNPFICPNGNVTLTAGGADSYVWTPPLGLNVTTGPVVIATPPSSIIYTVTGTNADGCSGSNTTTINYYNTSQVGILAVPNDGCNPVEVTLDFTPANLIANGTWNWHFGDYYSNINTSTDSTGHHIYQHEGNFVVTFTGLDINGCVISAHTNVDVYIKPNADFYNNPEVAYSDNPAITFVDLSYGANYWLWDFGDPGSYNFNFSYEMNPIHVFSDSGTYTIMLVVMSSHNCSDTAYHDVIIYPTPIVYIPNAFTPNGDRLNDVFRPVITGFDKSTYKFYIFDRWGREVFFSNDVYTGWDGKNKGKPIEIGVFSYIVYFNEYTGKEHKIIGSVTLIR